MTAMNKEDRKPLAFDYSGDATPFALSVGDCFLWKGGIYQKDDNAQQTPYSIVTQRGEVTNSHTRTGGYVGHRRPVVIENDVRVKKITIRP